MALRLAKEDDKSEGQKMIQKDLEESTHEAQLAAFKRHEMTKKLREAWTKQQQFKDNEKTVERIF